MDISGHPEFERLYNVPVVYYSPWLHKHSFTFASKKVLDFGCGEGYATTGIAKFCGAASVLGVDLTDEFNDLPKLLSSAKPEITVPRNVEFKQVTAGADLGENVFDVAVSWSALEHVSQDIFEDQLKLIHRSIKPGGCFLFQVAPLYYSPFGSHFYGLQQPWEHLYKQTSSMKEKVEAQIGSVAGAVGHWNCFVTLNKYTLDTFVKSVKLAGFTVLDVYKTSTTDVPPDDLLEVFHKEVLTTEQLLLLALK